MIGRDKELETLDKMLRSNRVVALVGPSGVGKTTIANAYSERFDASLFIDCFGIGDGELSARLNESAPDGLQSIDLLILDNWVPVLGVPDEQNAKIILTTQTPSKTTASLPIRALGPEDALKLFRSESNRVLPDASDSFDDIASTELSELMGGHPLGIVIAARHAAIFGASELLRLVKEGIELEDEDRDRRHRSMASALEFSWQQLNSEEQLCLYILSRFRRPVRVTSVALVSQRSVTDTMSVLGALAKRGIITTGPYPRPLELWIDVANRLFQDEVKLTGVEERIFEIAVDLAPDEYRGRPAEIGEGPSFWEAVVTGNYHQRESKEFQTIVRALLNWSLTFACERYRESRFLDDVVIHANDTKCFVLQAQFMHGDPNLLERIGPTLDKGWDAATDDTERSMIEFERGVLASVVGDNEAMLAHSKRARELHESTRTQFFEAMVTTFTGNHERARKIISDVQSKDASERALVSFGVPAVWSANIADRIPIAKQNLENAERLGDTRLEIAALRTLANTLQYAGSVEQANSVRVSALELAKRIRWSSAEKTIEREILFADIGRASIAELKSLQDDDVFNDGSQMLSAIMVVDAAIHNDNVSIDTFEPQLSEDRFSLPPLREAVLVARNAVALMNGAKANQLQGRFAELMRDVHQAHDLNEQKQMKLFDVVEPLYSDHTHEGNLCQYWVSEVVPPLIRNMLIHADTDADIIVFSDGKTFRVDRSWYRVPDTTAAVLLALADGKPHDFTDIGETVWPDEKMTWDALVNRVNVRVSALRKMGLKKHLLKAADGYLLSGRVTVVDSTSKIVRNRNKS